jgi:hypothetical protein
MCKLQKKNFKFPLKNYSPKSSGKWGKYSREEGRDNGIFYDYLFITVV